MAGLKISIVVNDPMVIKTLESKKARGEKTFFVNEALRFYLNNADNVIEIKQALIQLMDVCSKGIITHPNKSPELAVGQTDDDAICRTLADSIGGFL